MEVIVVLNENDFFREEGQGLNGTSFILSVIGLLYDSGYFLL